MKLVYLFKNHSLLLRQNKLKEIKQQINPEPPKKKVKAYKKTKTLKKKLILGKKNGKISVLIKNRKTRKKIKNETLKLKKKFRRN